MSGTLQALKHFLAINIRRGLIIMLNAVHRFNYNNNEYVALFIFKSITFSKLKFKSFRIS